MSQVGNDFVYDGEPFPDVVRDPPDPLDRVSINLTIIPQDNQFCNVTLSQDLFKPPPFEASHRLVRTNAAAFRLAESSNNMLTLLEGTSQEQSTYLWGLVMTSIVVFCGFLVASITICVLRETGYRRSGFLFGRFIRPKAPSKYKPQSNRALVVAKQKPSNQLAIEQDPYPGDENESPETVGTAKLIESSPDSLPEQHPSLANTPQIDKGSSSMEEDLAAHAQEQENGKLDTSDEVLDEPSKEIERIEKTSSHAMSQENREKYPVGGPVQTEEAPPALLTLLNKPTHHTPEKEISVEYLQ